MTCRSFKVLTTTSRAEPSATLRANPFLMGMYARGLLPLHEIERQAEGTERLREELSSLPFHARKAAKDPDYWNTLYGSAINY